MADKAGFKVVGVDQLIKDLKRFGPAVEKRALKGGVRRAAIEVRRAFKVAAPRDQGTLRKGIRMKVSRRTNRAWVGLRKLPGEARVRHYYKTLEFHTKRGAPLHPFMEKAWKRVRGRAAQTIVTGATKALYEEAGKAYAKSKARSRR